MNKTKEDILIEHVDDLHSYGAEQSILLAMDFYAQQTAVEFAKWKDDNYTYNKKSECYYHDFDWSLLNPVTTEQLFEIYLKEKGI